MTEETENARTEAAINWMVELSSGDVSERQLRAFEEWLQSDACNEAVWNRLQNGVAPFGAAAKAQLRKGALTQRFVSIQTSRRRFLRGAAGVVGAGALGLAIADRYVPLSFLGADHVTVTGQHKDVALRDGTSAIMAARTAFDVDVSDETRSLTLTEGQLHLQIAKGRSAFLVKADRFLLECEPGTFLACKREDTVTFTVLKGTGLVSTLPSPVLKAGERAVFKKNALPQQMEVDPEAEAIWTTGKLIADNKDLATVISELRPYFSGVIRLGAGVGQLRASAVLNLSEPLDSLKALALSLNLRMRTFSNYWVSIERAAA